MELLPILFKLTNIVLQVSQAYLYSSSVSVQKTGIYHKSGRSKFAVCYHYSVFPSAIHLRAYALISWQFAKKVLLLLSSLQGNLTHPRTLVQFLVSGQISRTLPLLHYSSVTKSCKKSLLDFQHFSTNFTCLSYRQLI